MSITHTTEDVDNNALLHPSCFVSWFQNSFDFNAQDEVGVVDAQKIKLMHLKVLSLNTTNSSNN
jgi:hypothetical protein